jgi:hypothetical protein
VKLALIVALLVLVLPAGASAGDLPTDVSLPPGTVWDGTHYVLPGQKPTSDPLLHAFLDYGHEFWRARGVDTCAPVKTWVAPDLGPQVVMRAIQSTCEVWAIPSVIADAHDHDRYFRMTSQVDECAYSLHEDGHLGGLPHSATGVMRIDSGDADDVGFVVSHGWRRAVGEGPCGQLVAATYNAHHPRLYHQRRALNARAGRGSIRTKEER